MKTVEDLKRMDLAGLLNRHYTMKFTKCGQQLAALSPFSEEQTPSFFLRCVDGHWLFKDFSSGYGGSIIDFVMLKEGLGTAGEAINRLNELVSAAPAGAVVEPPPAPSARSYNLDWILSKIQLNDPGVSVGYLQRRGIDSELTARLVRQGLVFHNRVYERSYCCFVVRDEHDRVCCLDNHQIDGDDKFVLGAKRFFTLDHDRLPRAEQVFITEGIIDYLSIKQLEGDQSVGIALLGNAPLIDPSQIPACRLIISALDNDAGGIDGTSALQKRLSKTPIEPYDLKGFNDPNELLQAVGARQRKKLTAERKLRLYKEFLRSDNKSELAKRWGIDRSYLYEIVKDIDKNALDYITRRQSGRPPHGKPSSLEEAWERIQQLEEAVEKEAFEKENWYARSELLQVRLKWAEIDVAETQGKIVVSEDGETITPVPKIQIKKKKKRRRSK